MPDPEYFLGAYYKAGGSDWQTTAFSDEPAPDEADHRAIWERKPLLCMPVPGQSMPKAAPTAAQTGISSLAFMPNIVTNK